MPRTKEQFEEMRNATRDKILSAAISVFAKKGFAAGVQEIADHAGVSVGLLYRHYKTKDEIFEAILNEALNGYEEVLKLFEIEQPPKEIVEIFMWEILSDVQNNEEFVQMMILLTQPFMSNLDFPWMENLLEGNRRMRAGLQKVIEKGQRIGEFKQGSAEQMAHHMFSCI